MFEEWTGAKLWDVDNEEKLEIVEESVASFLI